MSYSAEVLADSPLVYLRLGDGSGTTAADSSGNSRPATWTAAPTYVSGLLAGDADGAIKPNSQSAAIADAAWMDVSALTVEAWVKYDTVVASAGIVDRYAGGQVAVSSWLLYTPSSKFTFLIRDNLGDKTAQSAASISAGTTYHVVGTCDGSNVKLYVNGSLVATTACGPLAAGSAAITLGKFVFGGQFTNGTIDELAVYGTALSATRITAHYTAGTSSGSAASGTASLSLSASGTGAAAAGGSAALSLGASGTTAAPISSSAALSLSASGSLDAPTAASGTASLNLTASGTGGAAGTASASLALSASGSVELGAAGTAVLTFSSGGTATQLFVTDTSNLLNGRDRHGSATVTIARPVQALPATLVLAQKVDKALAYPAPVMVNGRPT